MAISNRAIAKLASEGRMNQWNPNIGGIAAYAPSAMANTAVQPPTYRECLEQKRADLSARLTKIEEAIAALDANPDIERILTLLGQAMVQANY